MGVGEKDTFPKVKTAYKPETNHKTYGWQCCVFVSWAGFLGKEINPTGPLNPGARERLSHLYRLRRNERNTREYASIVKAWLNETFFSRPAIRTNDPRDLLLGSFADYVR